MSGSDEGAASGFSPNTMTPEQCRAGRALIGWSVADLASKVGLDERLIDDFEAGRNDPASGTIEVLRSGLMTAGVVFTGGETVGVRLGRRSGDEGLRLDQLTAENDR